MSEQAHTEQSVSRGIDALASRIQGELAKGIAELAGDTWAQVGALALANNGWLRIELSADEDPRTATLDFMTRFVDGEGSFPEEAVRDALKEYTSGSRS